MQRVVGEYVEGEGETYQRDHEQPGTTVRTRVLACIDESDRIAEVEGIEYKKSALTQQVVMSS